MELEFMPRIYEMVLLNLSSIFLIYRRDKIQTIKWWIGFLFMIVPYVYFKSLGTYFDVVVYDIADAQGTTIGGGAAFGHLLYIAYAMGIIAPNLLSKIGYAVGEKIELRKGGKS